MKKLSICIPTYNRVRCLRNCLNSIYIAKKNTNLKIEVCISDNCSEENIDKIIDEYKELLTIKFHQFDKNNGLGVNILKTVSMADGEFSWILGNDDLLLPDSLKKIEYIFENKKNVDYFFINSYHLSSEYVFSKEQPFDLKLIPKNLEKFSNFNRDLNCKFFDLIDYRICFDFLLGQFLSIFRTSMWRSNLNAIDYELIKDTRVMSNIYNTFSHNIIFSKAFSKSNVFFNSEPLTINLYGERNWWKNHYAFVESVRIPELLDVYRKNGLSLKQYLFNKNFALRKLFVYLIKMVLVKDIKGWEYLKIKDHVLKNLLFPSIYIMPFFYLFRKIYKKTLSID